MADGLKAITLHKKRFGQFFSGKEVADLLVSMLPDLDENLTVIDPMAGIGDLLVAVDEHTHSQSRMLGVEIDGAIAQKAASRLPEATIIHGDAFNSREIITQTGWSLVITNPPYVRYQLQHKDGSDMPSGREIRANLLKQVTSIPYFSDEERALFIAVAQNYSGLSDMAVPAWILSAMLVKKGGYLAIVVPETWLNRDYASPIQYLLTKCFSIKAVMRDSNSKWFPEAQVKTCLVVAKRQELRPLAAQMNENTEMIDIDGTYSQRTLTLFPNMAQGKDASKWFRSEDAFLMNENNGLPHELLNLIGNEQSHEYIPLVNMGIQCGQGLRTGANDFFYVAMLKDDGVNCVVQSRSWDCGGREYCVPKDLLVPTLQSRSEISGLVVTPEKLRTRVIYLKSEACGDICRYVELAEQYTDQRNRKFKDYSAVKPNEKKQGNEIVRYWYELPKFSRRHLPNLCLTRISARVSECLYVEQNVCNPIAVDANMVTLWGDNMRTNQMVLAILNSTWSKLYLELLCTVMGGGALKIEANHLKRMLIPKLSEEKLSQLQFAGSQIIDKGDMTPDIQDVIDGIIFSPFDNVTTVKEARELLNKKWHERSANHE